MFHRIITRLGEDTVITGMFCWQEHMISSGWIFTLLTWEKMELKGQFLRGAETWARSYHKIRIGPSLLLHGSEYVHPHIYLFISSLLISLSSIKTLSASLSFLSSYSLYLYNVPPNSIVTDELIVLQIVPKLPLYLELIKFCYLGHIMSQMNSVNMLMP
jgi:hypothetical protein